MALRPIRRPARSSGQRNLTRAAPHPATQSGRRWAVGRPGCPAERAPVWTLTMRLREIAGTAPSPHVSALLTRPALPAFNKLAPRPPTPRAGAMESIVQPEILKQGTLGKLGGGAGGHKNWKDRYFVLSDHLYYYASKEVRAVGERVGRQCAARACGGGAPARASCGPSVGRPALAVCAALLPLPCSRRLSPTPRPRNAGLLTGAQEPARPRHPQRVLLLQVGGQRQL